MDIRYNSNICIIHELWFMMKWHYKYFGDGVKNIFKNLIFFRGTQIPVPGFYYTSQTNVNFCTFSSRFPSLYRIILRNQLSIVVTSFWKLLHCIIWSYLRIIYVKLSRFSSLFLLSLMFYYPQFPMYIYLKLGTPFSFLWTRYIVHCLYN